LAPKRPIQTPQREWLAEDLEAWTSTLFTKKNAMPENWFDQINLEMVLKDYKLKRPDNSFFIWQYMNATQIFDKGE
jgi:asparagine synthase (glutamine-hydrolysing)